MIGQHLLIDWSPVRRWLFEIVGHSASLGTLFLLHVIRPPLTRVLVSGKGFSASSLVLFGFGWVVTVIFIDCIF